jgi:hypothetical protein
MLIEIAILSTIGGVSSAIVQASKPMQFILRLLRMESLEMMRCRMCFGTWFVYCGLLAFGVNPWVGLFFAPAGGFIAEMTDRKLI